MILPSDLNDSVTKFQDLLLCAIDRHVPRITLRGRSRPPWMTAEVMKLMSKIDAVEQNEVYSFYRSFHAL